MNSLQLKNIAAPVVAIIVAWLSRKVPFVDPTTWSVLVDSVIATITAGVLGYFNRGSAVVASAAALPEVKTIIAEPAMASAITSPDVVSSYTNKVVAK